MLRTILSVILLGHAAIPTLAAETIGVDTLQPGMTLAELTERLGRHADSESFTGACGAMKIFTWHEEQLRVVSVGGNVVAITK